MASPTQALAKLETYKTRMAHIRQVAKEEQETILETIVGVGAAAALGGAEEYYGEDALMGASVPLIVGVVFTGAAIAGVGGEFNGAVRSIGRSGLDIEAYKWGSRMVREWGEEEPAATPTP